MNADHWSILATADCRAIDAQAMADGVSGFALMERAADAVVRRLDRVWPRAVDVTVIAGTGNNGGDGYVIARKLRKAGRRVRVLAPLGWPGGGDALRAAREYCAVDGSIAVRDWEPIGATGVVVDALFGTGLNRLLSGDAVRAVAAMNRCGCPVLCVDTPSGLETDTGLPQPDAVRASETVTFVAAKPGFFLGRGPDFVGRLTVDPIGLSAGAVPPARAVLRPMGAALRPRLLPRRPRTAHKGAQGRVLLIAGGVGMPGAARLAGEAALRVGAGLVTVISHPSHAAALALSCPELVCPVVETDRDIVSLMEIADVVAIGPGLGRGVWAERLWDLAAACRRPLVVDADALNRLAEQPSRRPDWVLTPHPGEAARLLGCTSDEVQRDRLGSVVALQARYGGVVILKGAATLVAGEGAAVPWVCLGGNPGMATAGMGDVLTGVVAGIAAQQPEPRGSLMDMAATAVQVHALAGDFVAHAKAHAGERGLIASDVVAALPGAVNP